MDTLGHEYSLKGVIISAIILVLLGIGFYYGVSSSNKTSDLKHKKSVDTNGLLIKAEVTDKIQRKGHQVYYVFKYKLRTFAGYKQDGDYYKTVEVGDMIDVIIDTTDPTQSYIYLPNEDTKNY